MNQFLSESTRKSELDLSWRKPLLPLVPSVDSPCELIEVRDLRFPVSDPVNRGQQLQTERRFESVDQIGHRRKTSLRVGLVLQERARLLQGARYKVQLPVGRVAAIGVAGYEMAFDGVQYVPEILGVRP